MDTFHTVFVAKNENENIDQRTELLQVLSNNLSYYSILAY